MKTIQTKENQITFATEISETLINSIRRYVNEIPVLAIDEVEISQNGSPLYDETLAHRMGLVPFKMEKAYKEDTEVKISLKKKGPGTIYSEDIKGDAKVVYEKIPLTIVKGNQEMDIKGIARLGKGSYHTKYSPGFIFYRNSTEVILEKSLLEQIKKVCPKNEIKEKGDKIIVVDNLAQDVCDICEGIAEKNKKTAEVKIEKDMIITVESFGQIEPKEIFKKAVEGLKDDLHSISKKFN